MKYVEIPFIILLSAGWVLPIYLACDSLVSFLERELMPVLTGKGALHSFPTLYFTHQMLAVGFGWLAIALAFWSFQGYKLFIAAKSHA